MMTNKQKWFVFLSISILGACIVSLAVRVVKLEANLKAVTRLELLPFPFK
jgi:hypothetical protein